MIHERDRRMDRQTDRRTPHDGIDMLMHSIARQKWNNINPHLTVCCWTADMSHSTYSNHWSEWHMDWSPKTKDLSKQGRHIIRHPVANHLHLPIHMEEICCADCHSSEVRMVCTQHCMAVRIFCKNSGMSCKHWSSCNEWSSRDCLEQQSFVT